MGDEEMGDTPSSSNGSNGRVTYKDVTDLMARLERDLHAGQARLEGKMDAFMMSHSTQHASEQSEFNKHIVEATAREVKLRQLSNDVEEVDGNLDSLIQWRAEVRGMVLLIKLALGSSLLGAAISIIMLVKGQ